MHAAPDSPVSPHTDATLRALRAQLLARGTQLRERLQWVQQGLRLESQDPSRAFTSASIIDENDEMARAIEKSARSELSRIDHALARFDEGTFALCDHCGKEIDGGRLRVVPCASECRACAREG
jgi:RNA polymerase-binding transcription factor DksA